MGLDTCPDCKREVSDRAEACPQCGRPTGARFAGPLWAFELAAVLAAFGLGSITYSMIFAERLIVDETRVKFWFGFQLVALAVAFVALGWWKRTRDRPARVGA